MHSYPRLDFRRFLESGCSGKERGSFPEQQLVTKPTLIPPQNLFNEPMIVWNSCKFLTTVQFTHDIFCSSVKFNTTVILLLYEEKHGWRHWSEIWSEFCSLQPHQLWFPVSRVTKWCLLLIQVSSVYIDAPVKSFQQKYVKKYWHYLSFTAARQTHQFFFTEGSESGVASPVIAKSNSNPSHNNLEITAFAKLPAKCPNISEHIRKLTIVKFSK